MTIAAHDRPWRRPGAAAYARRRIRALLHPPVEVYPTPPTVLREHDVAVRRHSKETAHGHSLLPKRSAAGVRPTLDVTT